MRVVFFNSIPIIFTSQSGAKIGNENETPFKKEDAKIIKNAS